MLFNSASFYVFFIVIVCIRFLPVNWSVKKGALLLGSYLFYAAWNPPFVILLWISTAIDWFIAKKLYRVDTKLKKKRQGLLMISLATNLGLLAYFKYGGFILDNTVLLINQIGFDFQPAPVSIILPVGISFYTFQSLSYSLDVYFKRIKPEKSILNFSLYVSFFPQLVAGPIVRSEEFLPQCTTEKKVTGDNFGWGLFLITLGLFQKAFIADLILAPITETLYSSSVTWSFINTWTGILAFSGQIYLDFSGYTNCAIGTALVLGFKLPENFRGPYAAIGFSDFWRRWHISLSSWLRDYLYIPLGGNRSSAISTSINVMITMLIGGLWHGASWNFVIWGGLHGFYLVLERFLKSNFTFPDFFKHPKMQGLMAFLTFIIITITWIFFRSPDLATSLELLNSLLIFSREGVNIKPYNTLVTLILTYMILRGQWKLRNSSIKEHYASFSKFKIIATWVSMIILLIYIKGGGESAFIYFQF